MQRDTETCPEKRFVAAPRQLTFRDGDVSDGVDVRSGSKEMHATEVAPASRGDRSVAESECPEQFERSEAERDNIDAAVARRRDRTVDRPAFEEIERAREIARRWSVDARDDNRAESDLRRARRNGREPLSETSVVLIDVQTIDFRSNRRESVSTACIACDHGRCRCAGRRAKPRCGDGREQCNCLSGQSFSGRLGFRRSREENYCSPRHASRSLHRAPK